VIYILFEAFIVSLIFIKVFIHLSPRIGLVDIPNSRSSHVHAISCSAGIPIFVTVFLFIFIFTPEIYNNYILVLFGIGLVFLLGIYDDLKELQARYKIIFIALATVFLCTYDIMVLNIGTYFDHTIFLKWMAIPVTIFSVVGLTNSFNLIDGLDGLASLIGIFILGGLWFIGYQYDDILLMELSSLVILSLLAFLIFNWNPAKVFMGDSGSLTLGFIISALCLKALLYVPPVVVLYLIAIPVIDTTIIIIRRKRYGKPIFSPDKNHIHHIVLRSQKDNVKKSVLIIAFAQLVYTFIGVFLIGKLPQEISLIFFLLNIVTWYFVLTHLSRDRTQLQSDPISQISST